MNQGEFDKYGQELRAVEQPLLLKPHEAAGLLGISRATFYRLHSSGRLPLPVRLGRSARWRSMELRAWVASGCPERSRWEAMKVDLSNADFE